MTTYIKDSKIFDIFFYENKKKSKEYNSIRDEINNYLLNEGYAHYMCRDLIEKKYIEYIINNQNIKGLVIRNKKDHKSYIGFIFFLCKKNFIDIKLLATIDDNSERNNVNIGRMMIYLLEEYSKINNIYIIKSNVIKESIHFYTKINYEIKKEKNNGMYIVQKNIYDNNNYIKKIFNQNIKNTHKYKESINHEINKETKIFFDEDGDLIMFDYK